MSFERQSAETALCIADDVGSMGLRLRLYGCERMRRERLIGECVVGFAMLVGATEAPVEHWLTLEPRSNLSVCLRISST